MSSARRLGIISSLALSGLLAVACGGNGSGFEDGAGSTNGGDTAGNNGSGAGFGDNHTNDTNGTSSGDPQTACVANQAAAARKPVKLLIVLDQSGSMGGLSNPTKWIPVTTALKSFLSQEGSQGIEASMRLFPTATGDSTAKCDSASYASPNVAMTALPNAAPFSAQLVSDPNFKNTPTRAVLKATVADAKKVQAESPDAKVAIVLITDGEPLGCSATDNDITNVASEVAGTKDTIPTYVIGVGSVDNLNTIAHAGGPRDAFVVATSDPTATQAQLLSAINDIRGNSIACDVNIPAPPSGQSLDSDKVNVSFTPSGKAAQLLTYDETCAGEGWRYDDKANPKQVVLCPTTCTAAKADPAAKLSLEFGCLTRGAKVR